MEITARCERSGRWWAINVPEVPGVFTQARRLDQAAAMTADAVATMLNIDPATVNVTLDFQAPGVEQVRAMQAAAGQAAREASAAARALAAWLHEDGLTVRDIAVMLTVSPQRVSQLLNS